jgi:hypothetical protein
VASAAETLEPRADVTIIVEGIMFAVAAGENGRARLEGRHRRPGWIGQ